MARWRWPWAALALAVALCALLVLRAAADPNTKLFQLFDADYEAKGGLPEVSLHPDQILFNQKLWPEHEVKRMQRYLLHVVPGTAYELRVSYPGTVRLLKFRPARLAEQKDSLPVLCRLEGTRGL
jgi:hypothetical protein